MKRQPQSNHSERRLGGGEGTFLNLKLRWRGGQTTPHLFTPPLNEGISANISFYLGKGLQKAMPFIRSSHNRQQYIGKERLKTYAIFQASCY